MKNSDILKIERLAKKYDETNIPLYLSYPVERWWKTPSDQELFIEHFQKLPSYFFYFHFPFCESNCYFCSCYKYVTTDTTKNDIYLEHLEKEFEHKITALGLAHSFPITQMHWGGGTPTFLSEQQIERFHKVISRHFEIGIDEPERHISVESYPDESLNMEKLKLLRGMGFNEISFGIQDFNSSVQKAINRNNPVDIVRKKVEDSKSHGFRAHVDLCYGLPFQGLGEFEQTLKEVVRINPDRIILYPYAHYPMSFPAQRLIPTMSLPNSFIKILQSIQAEEILVANGYVRVGYDHYVKPENSLFKGYRENKGVRNFMGSAIEPGKLLGFGNSAISFSGKMYFHNLISLDGYYETVNRQVIPVEPKMGHLLSRDDLIRHKVIQKYIMCDFQINKEEINQELQINFDEYFQPELKRLQALEKDGLVEFEGSRMIRVTSLGKPFVRHIAFVFDAYYSNGESEN